MPANNFLIEHWKKELEVFRRTFLFLQKRFSTDAVHDLRVAVKKLRAYFTLYSFLKQDKKSALLFTNTEKLFSALGKYRNLEMSLQLLPAFIQKTEPVSRILNKNLQHLLLETKKQAKDVIKEYDFRNLDILTKKIEEETAGLEESKLSELVEQRITDSLARVKTKTDDFKEEFHEIRKELKAVYYWSSFSPQLVLNKDEFKKLDKSLDHLGAAQDYETLRANLKYLRKALFISKTMEWEKLKKAEKTIKQKKEKEIKKAEEILNSIFK